MQPVDYATPRYTAGGEPSTKPAISPWASPTIWAARVSTLIGVILQVALSFGWLTPEQAAGVDPDATGEAVAQLVSIVMIAVGIVGEWGRRNGGTQPSPIKPLVGIAMLILVAGCTTTTAPSVRQTVAELCDAYNGAIETLTVAKAQGQLTAEQIAQVDKVRADVVPICGNVDKLAAADAGTVAELRPLVRQMILMAGDE